MEDIQPGELVFSRSEHDACGPIEAKVVEKKFERFAGILNVHIGGQVIRTTHEHPFYVHEKGWTPAKELVIGDWLMCADGHWKPVEDLLDTGDWELVYNLRVADHHTYFVGEEHWGWSLWAHNTYIYRAITDQDLAEYASNYFTHINPRGTGGTPLDQIQGGTHLPTKYISASTELSGTKKFRRGNNFQGVIKIKLEKLIELGSGIVSHQELLNISANADDPVRTRRNVEEALEILISNGIPKAAIKQYLPPNMF